MIATGAIAAVAFTFASYAAAVFGIAPSVLPWVAVSAIAVLSVVNYIGVQPAAWTVNTLTVLKLSALAGLIVAGLLLTPSEPVLTGLKTAQLTPPTGLTPVTLALAAAFVPVLFSYGGWQQTNFIAEELIEPERNLPRALVLGVLGVVTVYLLANLAYLRVLGVERLAASSAPAADTMMAVLGDRGKTLISVGILISTFGFLDLVIMVSPRVYQAMAADGLFFRSFATLHPRFRTPAIAIVAQGVWAMALIATRTYGQLLDYVTFADWIFFGAIAATIVVYRKRDSGLGARGSGGFRLPGYPFTLALFLLAAAYVVIGSITSNLGNAIRGTGLLLLGVPVFLYWSRQKT
jgi:APA family basic amino acid/polyamine antiporter